MSAPGAGVFCPVCRGALGADARFCIHCGSALDGSAPAYPTYAPNGFGCSRCGGDGAGLEPQRVYCPDCRWLRPLGPGYEMRVDAFLWRFDAEAMSLLRSVGPLTAAAQNISSRVGRPWFEASINGVRLSERQFPEIFGLAIRAARIMGLPRLPEIYISGDAMWDAITLGTETSAFIALGSVLTNFKPDDLLFMLGREMGHCRAGHTLWKTVMQFLSGQQQQRSILGGGVLKLLNPAKLVESAVDAPLMAWARHSEITADRAGLLVVGREDVARRALQAWTLKSFPLPQRINDAAWREQEDASTDATQRLAELTLSSTPAFASRLKLLRDFAATPELAGWRAIIDHWLPPEPTPPPAAKPDARRRPARAPAPDTVRLVCVKCHDALRIPRAALQGVGPIHVRCPNAACRAVLTVNPRPPGAAPAADARSAPTTDNNQLPPRDGPATTPPPPETLVATE